MHSMQTIPQHKSSSLPNSSLFVTFPVCVCVCVCGRCVCAHAHAHMHVYRWCVRNTLLWLYYQFWGFTVYNSVDLVKRGALTLVGEIRCYRNDHHYYYYYWEAGETWCLCVTNVFRCLASNMLSACDLQRSAIFQKRLQTSVIVWTDFHSISLLHPKCLK